MLNPQPEPAHFNPQPPRSVLSLSVIVFVFQMTSLWLREVSSVAQGHAAWKCQRPGLDLVGLDQILIGSDPELGQARLGRGLSCPPAQRNALRSEGEGTWASV